MSDNDCFVEEELSRQSVRSVNYHGSGSAFVTAKALAPRNSVEEPDTSSSGVDEPQVSLLLDFFNKNEAF